MILLGFLLITLKHVTMTLMIDNAVLTTSVGPFSITPIHGPITLKQAPRKFFSNINKRSWSWRSKTSLGNWNMRGITKGGRSKIKWTFVRSEPTPWWLASSKISGASRDPTSLKTQRLIIKSSNVRFRPLYVLIKSFRSPWSSGCTGVSISLR